MRNIIKKLKIKKIKKNINWNLINQFKESLEDVENGRIERVV